MAAPQRPSDPARGDAAPDELATDPGPAPQLAGCGRHGQRLVAEPAAARPPPTPAQRLLILDAWVRSSLPAGDFVPLVGVSKHTRCTASSGLRPTGCGRPTCSRLSSRDKYRRFYLVAFLDDHSRFLAGFDPHASQSSALVLEVLRASLGACGIP
jgi:hypothetical protein